MDKELYPIDQESFRKWILPIIETSYIWKGRPPTISHYKVFCAILYIFRTGIPWRDLPKCFGNWHSIYMRFQRGNEKALWWKILINLQKDKRLKMNFIICEPSIVNDRSHVENKKERDSQNTEAF